MYGAIGEKYLYRFDLQGNVTAPPIVFCNLIVTADADADDDDDVSVDTTTSR